MKYFALALVLAIAAISAISGSPPPPPPVPAPQSANGQANQGQVPTEEQYNTIVKDGTEKCNATNDELINLQNKNFNSTKPETWCFASYLCKETYHCTTTGDLNSTTLVNQQTSDDAKKAVKDAVDKCIKSNANVKNADEKTYKQLGCMLAGA